MCDPSNTPLKEPCGQGRSPSRPLGAEGQAVVGDGEGMGGGQLHARWQVKFTLDRRQETPAMDGGTDSVNVGPGGAAGRVRSIRTYEFLYLQATQIDDGES